MKKPKEDGRKGKHLTEGARVRIESGLNCNESMRAIANDIGRDPSTVSREIARHTKEVPAKFNDCVHKEKCGTTHLCGKKYCSKTCSRHCALTCMEICDKYEPTVCEVLTHPPFVCNGCRGYQTCSLKKRIYRAGYAHNIARKTLTESRSSMDITDEELIRLDALVSPLLLQGQSPYAIMKAHEDEIKMSLPTFYKMIDGGLLSAKNIDLKQKVGRKPRKRTGRRQLHNEVKGLSAAKAGHMWEDFLFFMEETDTIHVQMDCVEGKKNEPYAILTLHFPDFQMQIAMYLEKHDSKYVVDALNEIEKALGTDLFCEIFPVILTDNGKEFTNIEGMETSCLDPTRKRTKIFFCQPNRSDQKGSCENNHKLIRDVIPKGSSLMHLNQKDITIMMNHINSYRRKKAFGKSAYDLAMGVFPDEFFTKLGLERIPDDEVCLCPALLKTRVKARTPQKDYRPAYRKRNS